GLKNVAVRRVEVRGVDPVRADKLEVGQGLLRVHSEPDHLSREAGDLVPLVVDERLEGEVDARTVLVRGEPLLALAVLEGRVGGQLGNPRKPNLPRLATVLTAKHRGVSDQLVETARTEVVKLEVRGEGAVHRLSERVLLLQLRVDDLPHEVRNVVGGDGLLEESLRGILAVQGLSENLAEVVSVLNQSSHCYVLLSARVRRRSRGTVDE